MAITDRDDFKEIYRRLYLARRHALRPILLILVHPHLLREWHQDTADIVYTDTSMTQKQLFGTPIVESYDIEGWKVVEEIA